MSLVLLVEDDHAVRTAMAGALRSHGHVVQPVGSALDALRTITDDHVDLVVLDLGLPDLDGFEALRLVRGITDVPVIIATARRDEPTIVRLLNAGADDYLVKPFSTEHLTARVAAVLRRSRTVEPADESPVRIDELQVDVARREATLAGTPLTLTRREFDLLAYLATHLGRVVSKSELCREVWKQPNLRLDQTIDVHLSWLRRKLGESASAPKYLHTVRGVGVKLVEPCDSSSSA
ncbi:response regulator transcription factor [Pseudonocardia sp. TRM90224]|uniref:response regulator transcription factor n=1 Tax=Pseudonocardia sp. TRM90224 TaxID=2812678 RepID=UPI001E2A863E|nr:response regulator transcription factor [Pseudonocardia sp. TRM90224]